MALQATPSEESLRSVADHSGTTDRSAERPLMRYESVSRLMSPGTPFRSFRCRPACWNADLAGTDTPYVTTPLTRHGEWNSYAPTRRFPQDWGGRSDRTNGACENRRYFGGSVRSLQPPLLQESLPEGPHVCAVIGSGLDLVRETTQTRATQRETI